MLFIPFQLYISLAGILCIGLAILFSYGIAMYAGFIYGPIHALMPFLLLGKFGLVWLWPNAPVNNFFSRVGMQTLFSCGIAMFKKS